MTCVPSPGPLCTTTLSYAVSSNTALEKLCTRVLDDIEQLLRKAGQNRLALVLTPREPTIPTDWGGPRHEYCLLPRCEYVVLADAEPLEQDLRSWLAAAGKHGAARVIIEAREAVPPGPIDKKTLLAMLREGYEISPEEMLSKGTLQTGATVIDSPRNWPDTAPGLQCKGRPPASADEAVRGVLRTYRAAEHGAAYAAWAGLAETLSDEGWDVHWGRSSCRWSVAATMKEWREQKATRSGADG